MRRLGARVASAALILLLVFAASRWIVRALPGDPAETILAESGAGLDPAAIRAELGLDRPFLPALGQDLQGIARGDWGRSLLSREPIAPLLAARCLRTAWLAACSLLLGLGLALGLGLSAAGRGRSARIADAVCSLHGAVATAVPTPWLGPILMYVFAVMIPLLPISGGLALPALTLSIPFSGLWARLVRERVRETLRLGSAQGARARGIPEWRVVVKYGLAPAAGSLIAYLGTQFGALLGGAFVTEVIFDWPGLGSLLVESVLKRDYPLVEAAVFAAAAAALLGSLLGDWARAALDPRKGTP